MEIIKKVLIAGLFLIYTLMCMFFGAWIEREIIKAMFKNAVIQTQDTYNIQRGI